MTRDDAVTRIQRILGFTTSFTTEIIDALKDAQVDLETGVQYPQGIGTFLPWFLIPELSYIDTVADEERVPLPSDYIQEAEISALWIFDSTATDPEDEYTHLAKGDLDALRVLYPGTGQPRAYALVGQYYRLKPTPDDVYRLKHIYYAKDAVLSSNIENNWLKYAPTLMIGTAGRKIAAARRDQAAVAEFQRMELEGRTRLFAADEGRKHENMAYVMGGQD